MAEPFEWVLLAYRLPREPSTPRITVWRKLKRLGVAQLLDGLVALPADARSREQLERIADEVAEAGGTATLWVGRPDSAAQQRAVAAAMAAVVADDYAAVLVAANEALGADEAERRRTLARLGRQLQRIGVRDHFPPPARNAARRAVAQLGASVAVPA